MGDLPARPSGDSFPACPIPMKLATLNTLQFVYTSVAEIHRAATFDVRYELGSVKVQVELGKYDNLLDLEIT